MSSAEGIKQRFAKSQAFMQYPNFLGYDKDPDDTQRNAYLQGIVQKGVGTISFSGNYRSKRSEHLPFKLE